MDYDGVMAGGVGTDNWVQHRLLMKTHIYYFFAMSGDTHIVWEYANTMP